MSAVLKFIEYPGNVSLCMQIERSQLKQSVGYTLRHCVAIITYCKNRTSSVKTDGNIHANNISINLKIAIKNTLLLLLEILYATKNILIVKLFSVVLKLNIITWDFYFERYLNNI